MPFLTTPPTKQLANEQCLTVYGASLCCLITVVVAIRWCHRLCRQKPVAEPKTPLSKTRDTGSWILRNLNRRSRWEWPGRPSWGLIALVCVYVATNMALSSTMLALHLVNHWASRFGWLAVANMVLCVFFGLRNTPLALMTIVSHTQLNTLHRTVGYATVFLVLLHALFYTFHLTRQGRLEKLLEFGDLAGIGAGIAMLILGMGILRHRGYEIFLATHILGFIAVVLLTALHRPNWAKKLPYIMVLVGCMWLSDRLIRTWRLIYGLLNNSATLYPLPDGATRVVLRKPPSKGSSPGLHYYLWIPGICLLQNHPFTAVSHDSAGLEFVIKAQGGFTNSLHELSRKQPGGSFWASVDGPYGQLPDAQSYDEIVLIAGGSGAAFTFGLLNHILGELGEYHRPMHFLLAVKTSDQLSWFYKHLKDASGRGIVKLTVYITRAKLDVLSADDINPKLVETTVEESTSLLSPRKVFSYDTIRCVNPGPEELPGVDFRYEKMDVASVVQETVGMAAGHKRILVAACGPRSLLEAVKELGDQSSDRSIDVHCEDFDG